MSNFEEKSGWPRTYSKSQQGADADWGVLDGVTLVQPGEYD